MSLDTFTVGVMIVVIAMLLSCMLLLAGRHAGTTRGIGWWAAGQFFLGIGLIIVMLRDVVATGPALVIGSAVLAFGVACAPIGIQRYKGEAPNWGILVAAIVLTPAISVWFTLVEPDVRMRVILISILFTALSANTARLLLVPAPSPLRTAYWIAGGSSGLFALTMGLRAIITMADETVIPPGPLNASDPINLLTFLIGGVTQLTTTFGFILMINYRMAMDLERLASLDSLTGALNRRSLEDRLKRISARQRLCMIMIDIDHFKSVNDRYGHPAGDVILQELTRLVRGMLRDQDLFARMGGEEFCVVLVDADERLGARIGERIRQACELRILQVGMTAINITVSAGIADGIVSGNAFDVLVSQSDQAMYAAKQAGRNRIVRWSSMAVHSGLDAATPAGFNAPFPTSLLQNQESS